MVERSEETIGLGLVLADEQMRQIGFSEFSTTAAEVCSRLGARRILAIHGLSKEQLQIEYKAEAGMTPKTLADIKSGNVIKALIHRQYPFDSVNEEETGLAEGKSNRIWYVDPLDGTSSYAEGQRYSTTGVAVYENGIPLSAAICQPFEKELLIAERGKGTFIFPLNEKLDIAGSPRKLEIPEEQNLKGGIIFLDALFTNKTTPRKLELIRQLVDLSGGNLGIRMTGSNIDQQRQVAAGRGVLTITDAVGGFWDLAAGALIIKEAGGFFCDINGNPINKNTQVAVGGCKMVIDQILTTLHICYNNYLGFK